MRSYDEIRADVDAVSEKLRAIHGGLGWLMPVAQNSPIGREALADRAERLAKLDELKAERLAVAKSGVKG